ncbi:MAG: hypothetical protein RL594_1021 [Bacteroidota bacterium]|jgi:cobalt-zinc-cadmium efflux system membrane fusion protein
MQAPYNSIVYGRMSFAGVSLVMLTAVWILSSCATESGNATDELASTASADTIRLTAAQQKHANLEFGMAVEQTITDDLRVYGTVHVPPQYSHSITTPFGGIVRTVRVLEGSHVHANEALVTLEHPDFITMQQEYLQAKTQLDLAERELDRQRFLSRDSVNPRKTVERAQAEVTMLRIQTRSLSEKLALLNIKAASLTESSISRQVTLRSPITGFVTRVNVNTGGFVDPNTPILHVIDPHHMHIELAVFERDIATVHVGDSVRVRITDHPDSLRSATVHLVGKSVRADQTIPVHVHLDRHDARLTPGTSLSAFIKSRPRTAWTLPESAIIRSGKLSYVLTGSPGQLIRKPLRIRSVSGGLAEVLDPQPWLRTTPILVKGASRIVTSDE